LQDRAGAEENFREHSGFVAVQQHMNTPINLDELRIASPCNARWEDMTGDERARFCGGCRKHVYNFSAMSRREVETLIREKEGSVCGRFYQRPDGRMLTADCLTGRRQRRSRVARWAGSVFATVMLCFGVRVNVQAEDTNKIKMGKPAMPHTNRLPVAMGEMAVMGDVAAPPVIMGTPLPPKTNAPSQPPMMGAIPLPPRTNFPASAK
jgi:hypothetical protein